MTIRANFHTSQSGVRLDGALSDLTDASRKLAALPLPEILSLSRQCRNSVGTASREWVRLCCEAKQISPDQPVASEEILSGPVGVLRYLNLMELSLGNLQSNEVPRLPASLRKTVTDRLECPVVPVSELYDPLIFMGLSATVRFLPETTPDQIFSSDVARMRSPDPQCNSPAVVLGAGNVSSIPVVDALGQIFQKRRAVLLKLNPVNDYLEAPFQRAFEPLVKAGFLKILSGDAEFAQAAITAPSIDAVHITGSGETYQKIYQSLKHRFEENPSFELTSELGNVTPWIVIPGRYSHRQLRAQADQIVASIVNNASFNCIATKMILTAPQWPQREEFLTLLDQKLRSVPTRAAYYPGAKDRFQTFAKRTATDVTEGELPWILLRDVHVESRPELFQEESFVCVAGETTIPANSDLEFLKGAVDFVNQKMTGTLAAALTVPSQFAKTQHRELEAAIDELDYGTVCLNVFPGVGFGLMSPPWGGSPRSTREDPKSGTGVVHNTFFLDRIDKTVVRSKLKLFPKPVWGPHHRTAHLASWKLHDLYVKPSLSRIPPLLWHALRG